VTDNLGVQTLVETYSAQVESARRGGRADPYPNGAVFIVLDATTRYDARLSSLGDIGFVESLATGAGLTSTALLNRASSATLAELIVRNAPDGATAKTLRGQIRELEAQGYLTIEDRTGHRVRVVHLALTKVDDLTDVPFESFGESVNSIATYFNIDATEAFHLYQAAELLVEEKFEQPLTEIVAELERRTGRVGATTEPAQR